MKTLLKRIRRRPSCSHPPGHQATAADRRAELGCQLPDASAAELDTLIAVESLTMTSPERILSLIRAVDYLCRQGIAGDIVECGVWRGGSMAAVARTLLEHGDHQRPLWLYDTFTGMSEPTADDVDFRGQAAEGLLASEQINRQQRESIWCVSPLEQVQRTMADTGYPSDRIHYIVGKVEETLVSQSPGSIALLRLDTDWYESTRCEMETLFPRLVPGGVLIVDDYGHWEGCRRAVDEYLRDQGIPMLLQRIDYTGRLGIAPPRGHWSPIGSAGPTR